jgi:DNA-binding GntR family transcriptional regulator
MIKQRQPESNPEGSRKKQVADELRDRIFRNTYAPGSLLPTVRSIAEEFGCSPVTAHEALRILRQTGLIVVRPRQGTIVAIPQQSISGPDERRERSAAGGLFRPTENAEMVRVALVHEAPPDALEAFGQAEDGELGLREYVERSANRVVTYGASYIHPDVWRQVPELREAEPIPDGIIGAVQRVLGRRCVGVPTRRRAAFATAEEAAWLGVDEDSPVLVEITECVAEDGGIIEWNVSVHPEGYWVGA